MFRTVRRSKQVFAEARSAGVAAITTENPT